MYRMSGEELEKVLKENGVFEKYLDNLKSVGRTWDKFILGGKPRGGVTIFGGFPFIIAIEGPEFWLKICEKIYQ